MRDDMAHFLMQFYGFSSETARELLAEMRSTKSLQRLETHHGPIGRSREEHSAHKSSTGCATSSVPERNLIARATEPLRLSDS